VQSEEGAIVLSSLELHGRWGLWFVELAVAEHVTEDTELGVTIKMEGSSCAGTPECSGHGTCIQQDLSSWCRCDPGWFGHMCEVCYDIHEKFRYSRKISNFFEIT
jgi:hypothetical protein